MSTPSTAADASTKAPSSSQTQASAGERPLVMQIIIDRAITKAPEWSRGALIAQGAHAAIAIIAQTANEAATKAYIAPDVLGSMHKIVLVAPKSAGKGGGATPVAGGGKGDGDGGERSPLLELSAKLEQARAADEAQRREAREGQGAEEGDEVLGMRFPRHHLWLEQPENMPTAIAIAPNRKPPALKKILDKCTLLRD